MNYRPRRSQLSPEQWQVQRERFQIDDDVPPPVDEHVTTVKEPLEKLVASLGLKCDTLQRQLMNQWEQIAGKPLCRHIRPGPLQNGTLTVYVSNSAMLTELSRFHGKALQQNIQKAVGEAAIKKVRYQLDPDTRPERYA